MTSFVAVLPAIIPDLARSCIASMAPELRARLLLVDNTETGEIADEWSDEVFSTMEWRHNAGVTAAWNWGIARASVPGCQWLMIVSQSIEFGAAGGLDLVDGCAGEPYLAHSQHAWHALMLNRRVWERVGIFDPTFPAYGNESDYLYRMGLAGLPSPRENGGELTQVNINASCAPDGECLRRGVVKLRYADHLEAYGRKWGGPQGQEKWTHPYNLPELDWTFTGDPPGWETHA